MMNWEKERSHVEFWHVVNIKFDDLEWVVVRRSSDGGASIDCDDNLDLLVLHRSDVGESVSSSNVESFYNFLE